MGRCGQFIFPALSCVVGAALATTGPASAAPSERLVMPYSCGFERGRLVLRAAEARTYTILGPREQQSFTSCGRPSQEECSTLMVHRFALVCGGVRVSWVRIAAALKTSAVGQHAFVNGRLHIRRLSAVSALDARPCFDLTSRAGGRPVDPKSGDCLPWRPASVVEKLVLPEGFAPVGEIGARFVFGGGSGDAAVVLAANDGPGPADHSVTPGASQSPSREGFSQAATAGSAPDWVTVVEARDLSEQGGTWSFALMMVAMAVGVLVAAGAGSVAWMGLAAYRRHACGDLAAGVTLAGLSAPWLWLCQEVTQKFAAQFARSVETGAPNDPSLANAAENVAALLHQTEVTVAGLRAAAPLRDVLEEEVGHIRRRLAVAKASALDGKGSSKKIGAQFRALIFELERVRRIALSAAASLTDSRQALSIPRTRSEAYAVLGVNADASEGILKKIVDALRMTWHPDHAKDEDDRRLREDRIKQINIAWELIAGKRRVA